MEKAVEQPAVEGTGFMREADDNASLIVLHIKVHKRVKWHRQWCNYTLRVDARKGFPVWRVELMEWNQQMEDSFCLLAKSVLWSFTFVHVVRLQLTCYLGSV